MSHLIGSNYVYSSHQKLSFQAIVRHIPVTLTRKVHIPVLSELSVALHVTVFVPTLKLPPEAGVHATEGVSPESSVADI